MTKLKQDKRSIDDDRHTYDNCENCRFFRKWSKPGGECRRNAPQAVAIHADIDDCEHIAYWPGVDRADWCGEWSGRP
jgi:hypothetical protein